MIASDLLAAGYLGRRLGELARLTGRAQGEVPPLAMAAGAERVGADIFLHRSVWQTCLTMLLMALDEAHRRHPAAAGIPRERLRASLPPRLPQVAFGAAIERLVQAGELVEEAGLIRHRAFKPLLAAAPAGGDLPRAWRRRSGAAAWRRPTRRQ